MSGLDNLKRQADSPEEPAEPRGGAPIVANEEARIGDQTHDHLWWGKTGRPTEQGGVLGHDNHGASEQIGKGRVLGHDDDWHEK